MMGQLGRNLPPILLGGQGATADEITGMVVGSLVHGDVILVKGSLGMAMAPIVSAIHNLATPDQITPPKAAFGG
jgi:hypothetical protein